MNTSLSVFLSVLSLATASAVEANSFMFSSGSVDTRATAVSGKRGSSSGAIIDDPAAISASAGVITTSDALAVAGPVPAGLLVTLPGTAGIASGTGVASLDARSSDLLGIFVSASNEFINLDGGLYQGSASAEAIVRFSVSAPVDYTLSGIFSVDPEDVVWKLQLKDGPDGFLFNNSTVSADAGNFLHTGTLQPGFTYQLQSNVSILDTLESGAGVVSSSSLLAELQLDVLTVIPEPSSAAFLAASAVLLLGISRRRRRAS